MTNGSGRLVRVVDSWAVVAWMQKEVAAPKFRQLLLDAEADRCRLLMNWYNAGEAFYSIAKRSNLQLAEDFMTRLPSLPIRMVLPDEDAVMAAARIKAAHPLAFGDAFAIALAQTHQASVITGDNEIRKCGLVPVDWIGD